MKTKFFIISLVVGVIICILAVVHLFAISQIGKNYDDTQNISDSLQNDMIKNQQLSNLKKSFKNAGEENVALMAIFIKNDDIPSFIQSLETIMKNLKIVGSTKSVSERTLPELTPSGKNELLVSFEAEAPYSNLMQFVSILESLPYKSYISSATIIKEASGQVAGATAKPPKTNLWKLNLTLNIVKIVSTQP